MTTTATAPSTSNASSNGSARSTPASLPPAPDPAAGRDLTDEQADFLFDCYGYRILRNVVSPDQLSRINGWVDRQDIANLKPGDWVGDVEVHTYGGKDGGTDGVNFQNVMCADEPAFQELIDNPKWVDLMRRYIEVDAHRLSMDENFLNVRQSGGFIPIHSGGGSVRFTGLFHWHNGKWAVGQINVLMALTDIGPGDGATTIFPASHKSTMQHPDEANNGWARGVSGGDAFGMCEVHLKAGDAVMFTDGICHGSMPRTNPGARRAMVYRYSPHLLANRMNYVPSEEFLAKLTDAQKQIVQPVSYKGRPGRTMSFERGTGVGG